MKKYNHLTKEQRYTISVSLKKNMSVSAIAKLIEVSKARHANRCSTVLLPAVRSNSPLTARKLISAHHMIGHPEKGIKPALILPTLCRLQALGALRRA